MFIFPGEWMCLYTQLASLVMGARHYCTFTCVSMRKHSREIVWNWSYLGNWCLKFRTGATIPCAANGWKVPAVGRKCCALFYNAVVIDCAAQTIMAPTLVYQSYTHHIILAPYPIIYGQLISSKSQFARFLYNLLVLRPNQSLSFGVQNRDGVSRTG